MFDTIFAIDLGRYKCVACVYSRADRAGGRLRDFAIPSPGSG